MSRRHLLMRNPLRRTALVATCCAVALAVAGCGAGKITQTDSQASAVDGATADVGTIAIRDVLIPYPDNGSGAYPAGSDVPLQLTIVNHGGLVDTLVSVSSPVAERVLVQGTTQIPSEAAVVAKGTGGHEASAGAPSATASPSPAPAAPSAEPGAHGAEPSATPEAAPHSAEPSAEPGAQSGAEASPLDVGEVRIVLLDITQPLRAGLNTEITFVFRKAGSVTIPVPIGSPQEPGREPLEGAGEHS